MNTEIKIIKLNPEDYPGGKKVIFTYTSDRYYDVVISKVNGWKIELELKYFDTPFTKSLLAEIFEPYKPGLECYIAEQNGKEIGIISFNLQVWNNTIRIWDLYIDNDMKRKGIGTILINLAKKRAAEINARAIILETQTSNYNAIQFYLKNGFELVGFDKICYSNKDIESKEVRIEMGYMVKQKTPHLAGS